MTYEIGVSGYRKVLGFFLTDLRDRVGWWYRLPQMNRESPINQMESYEVYPPDNIMPHLGRVFGLHEGATAVVLELMNLCTIDLNAKMPKHTTRIKLQGWDDLAAEFKVEELVEVKQSRISGQDVWFIRLGIVPPQTPNPVAIWRAWVNNPKSITAPDTICGRRTTSYVSNELISIMKHSPLFEKLFQTRHFQNTSYANDHQTDPSSESDTNDDDSKLPSVFEVKPVGWTLKSGELPNATDFPICHAFGIPISNKQTTELLLAELIKITQNQNAQSEDEKRNVPAGSFVVCGVTKRQDTLYLPIPHGKSFSTKKKFKKESQNLFCGVLIIIQKWKRNMLSLFFTRWSVYTLPIFSRLSNIVVIRLRIPKK